VADQLRVWVTGTTVVRFANTSGGYLSIRVCSMIRRYAEPVTVTAAPSRTFEEGNLSMTSYTITITPEDADGTTTTLRLDVTGGAATLTDVHLHAGAGLSAGQLPAIDYALLLRAVGQETGAPAKATAARKAAGRGRQPAKRTRRAAPAAAEPTRATRSRAAAKKAARSGGTDGRAYRRMPEDLTGVYKRIGGTTAVAEHYGVPRHTVQGWLRRLRAQGVLPAR
jgi:hypothetical protein